jgi:SHS2 domain-containing protein
MRNGYRFIEHTADVGIEIFSTTLESVFEQAGQALFELIAPGPAEAVTPFAMETEGEDPESLVVNFLNDLLLHFEVEGLLFRQIKTRRLEAGRLIVDAMCEPLDPGGEGVDTVVKAATHHNLAVRQVKGRWHAVVYLDL